MATTAAAPFLAWLKERKAKLPDVYCCNRHCRGYLGRTRYREDVESWHCTRCGTMTHIASPEPVNSLPPAL